MISFLYFFRDQIISIHDGKTIKPSLNEIVKGESILGAYLFNDKGELLYSPTEKSILNDSLNFEVLSLLKEDISFNTVSKGTQHFSRASIRFSNSPSCYFCHSSEQKTLGYVVLDFSLHQYEDTIAYTRNFGIFFTALMLTLILIFVLIMHYRFIKKSLSEFKTTINVINSGNLDGRVKIPESKELGELGESFNMMIDQFQHAQQELQHYHQQELSNKQKFASIGEMSARLAHEIRNPITGIANAVEIIIEETENEQNKTVLEEIRRQANRVSKAISNLLNYSRTKELNLQEANINEIIKSVIFFLKNQVNQKSINFRANLGENMPLFKFDVEKIENVLLNLGMNAIQTIAVEGEIIITSDLDHVEGKVLISFKDNGKGIPEDKITEIFNPFFTLRTEGTGLGLAIVKEIVEMHNGEVIAYNNADKGCTFIVSLPLN